MEYGGCITGIEAQHRCRWDVGVAYPSKVGFFSLVSIKAEGEYFFPLIQRGKFWTS